MRYDQIKPTLSEEILDEVKMSPSALMKFANSPEAEGMLMGIEFEMCVPNVAVDDDSGEGEYDYDMDERAYSIADIVDFFQNGEMSNLSSSGAQRLREKMWDEYLDWVNDKISDNLDTDELEERIRDRIKDDVDWEDYIDEAREELGDDAVDDAVEERARELADEYVDSLMGDSREYSDAYDDIRQEMEDDMRNDSDYDEESWLSDIGVDYMSEAEREWGLDWPHWRSYGGDGELDVDQVGDEFAQAMGLSHVNTSNSYHGASRDGKNWIIEPDSSIDAEQGDGGLEFVSPPMPIKQGLEMIQKMYAWAKKEGCYTNRSTGLHMNISVPDMTIDKLDYVKLALFLGDEHVLKQFGREYNSYCKSAISKIKDRIKPEDVPAVLAQMKQHLNSLASKTIHSGITDKYTSINTKSNYVEFRGPGGDYLDRNPFDIINTALRLSMSLRIATDPEAYKQEYAKKLFKLVEQEKDPDNSVKLFSQYAVGELPKEDLVARLKFAKKERELEKAKKGGIERLMNDPAVKQKVSEMPEKWRNMLTKVFTFDPSEIQSTINNLESGEYDDELDADVEVPLAIAILQNELDYRKETGERKSYWVFNKDGTGGKQMVFANNENEAILTGGKNMGMSREQSITKLKAELKTEKLDVDKLTPTEYADMLRSLPTYTLEKFVGEIKTRSRGTLETALRNVKTRQVTGNLSDQNYEFLEAVIEHELKRRDVEGEPEEPNPYGKRTVYSRDLLDKISALPNQFYNWVMNIPTKELDQLYRTRVNALNGDYDNQLTLEQKQLLVSLIDDESSYRSSRNEDMAPSGTELQFQPGTPMQVGTPEPANAEELFTSLPDYWRGWLLNAEHYAPDVIQRVIDRVANGSDDDVRALSVEQRDLIISRAQDELRSRREPEAQPQQGEWPRPWNGWVENIQNQDYSNLVNVRTSMADPTYRSSALNDQQKAELVRLIDDELRRRTAAAVASGEQARAARDELQIEPDADAQPAGDEGSSIEFEPDQDAAIQQQAELINRDDPVTSNDPEAQSPLEVPGQGTQDFEIVNPHTGSRVAIIRQATLDHAENKARQWEQDLGLSAGDLEVREVGQTNESLNTIRRLAGLR